MDFLNWWFETHYWWALLFSPGASFIWALYQNHGFIWTAGCLILTLLKAVSEGINRT